MRPFSTKAILWTNTGYRREVDAICCNARCSLAPKRRIESRLALWGNHTRGGSQASENIAFTRHDGLAMLHCVSITAAHNIVGPCNASWRKFFLVLLQALEHVVCHYRHTAAVFLKFFAAT